MDLESLQKEYDQISQELITSTGISSDVKKLQELSKRQAELQKLLEKRKKLEDIEKNISENQQIIKSHEDPELSKLAEEEIKNLIKEREEIKGNLKEQGKDKRSAIMEIRAGTGGDEAALFAASLFRMYNRYADKQGWETSLLTSNKTEVGGYKEIIFEVLNHDVYSKLSPEAGVHRVQRIPETEKSGRIHTSTASVAVLPRAKKGEIEINSKDLKIDTFRSSGPGGQYVNKAETAIRITHLPSGIVVSCQAERSQQRNKEKAMEVLRTKLLDIKKKEEAKKRGTERKSQIGSAERSEKIRTYNFPQDRVTDHRIKKSWHNIERILDGEIDPIISALQRNIE